MQIKRQNLQKNLIKLSYFAIFQQLKPSYFAYFCNYKLHKKEAPEVFAPGA
jgi:hypothetical protein